MSTQVAKKREYTTEDRMEAMAELARWNGSPTLTAKKLKERGKEVPRSTLEKWRGTAEYEEVRDKCYDQTAQRVATKLEDVISLELEVKQKVATELASRDFAEVSPKELSEVDRNVTTSVGISYDKGAHARGRPTVITEKRDYQETIRALEAMGVAHREDPRGAIESTATEIPADVVEGATT